MFMSLGRLLFDKKRLLNIIVIIQLGISLTIANLLIGNYNKMHQAYDFTKSFDDSVAFFTALKPFGEELNINIDYDIINAENTTIELFSKKIEGSGTQIFCYGKNTCNGLIKNQIKKGEWPSNINSDGVIDCVVIGNGYEIGDTFTEGMGNETFSFRVSGTLGSKAMIINPSRASSSMTAEQLFYEYNANKNGTAIICSSKSLSSAAGTYNNGLVFDLTDNSTEHLNSLGKIFNMAKLRENSIEELSYNSSLFFPLAICFCLIGIVTAICMTFMNLLANEKVFDVYFRVGMRKLDAFLLNLGYMCWIIFGIIIITSILFLLCCLTDIISRDSYLASFNNLLFSIGYMLLIAFGTSAASMLVLKPTDISKN